MMERRIWEEALDRWLEDDLDEAELERVLEELPFEEAAQLREAIAIAGPARAAAETVKPPAGSLERTLEKLRAAPAPQKLPSWWPPDGIDAAAETGDVVAQLGPRPVAAGDGIAKRAKIIKLPTAAEVPDVLAASKDEAKEVDGPEPDESEDEGESAPASPDED